MMMIESQPLPVSGSHRGGQRDLLVKEDASEEVRRHRGSWPRRFSLRLREVVAERLLHE